VDSYLDEIVNEDDPWNLLGAIERFQVDESRKHEFYPAFVSLVSQRPDEADRDALIRAGAAIFHYRQLTARAEIERLRSEGADTTRISSSIMDDDMMAEIVHQPGGNLPIRYVVYRRVDGEEQIEFAASVQLGTTRHLPPQTRLVETGTVLLPTETVEYGDQATLLRDIREFISSYLYIEDRTFLSIVAYYILLTWVYDRFDVVPYLRAMGAWGSGKTRLLQVVGYLGNRTINAGGATTAAPIFRIMERFHGMLIVDEADFSDSDVASEVTKILTTGYMRGFPVLRAERSPDDRSFDVMGYDCYGPKVLSTRKKFTDDALESRCITHIMLPVSVPDGIPFFLGTEFRERAVVLRNKLLLWRFRTWRTAEVDPRRHIRGLDARLNQIVLPMIACANGDESMERTIIRHAMRYQETMRETRRESFEGRVAWHLLRRWPHRKAGDRVLVSEVVESLRHEFDSNPNMLKKIDHRYVAGQIRTELGLATRYEGGASWAVCTERDAQRIADRFSISEDQYLPLVRQNRQQVQDEMAGHPPVREPVRPVRTPIQ